METIYQYQWFQVKTISFIFLIMVYLLPSQSIGQQASILYADPSHEAVHRRIMRLYQDDWTNQDNSQHYWNNGRNMHGMAYVGDDKVLLFGGLDKGLLGDTFVYTLSTNVWYWNQTSTHPNNRAEFGLAHIGGDHAVLFGGTRYMSNELNDTWIYDRSAGQWTDADPPTKPSKRLGHAMAYLGDDKVLLFGGWPGSSNNVNCHDTWIYDLNRNNWLQMTPENSPPARRYHDMAYLGGDQVLLFGGEHAPGGVIGNDTWIYDLSKNTWTKKSTNFKPASSKHHAMAYIGNGQVVLYGANGDETWIYDLASNSWTVDENSTDPGIRNAHRMGETSMDGSTGPILFGGSLDEDADLETWVFGGGDYLKEEYYPPMGFRSLVEYEGAIPIAWSKPDLPDQAGRETAPVQFMKHEDALKTQNPTGYTVCRSTSSGGTYTEIASNINRQYFRDENVNNGQTYYYKVKAVYAGGESDLTSYTSSSASSGGYTIHSGEAEIYPTLDGFIDASEWSDASQTVITHPDRSGSVILYFMNNSEKLYVAVDDKLDTSLDHYDQFTIFFDQNKNREFPSNTPSDEGNFWIAWDGDAAASFTLFGPRSGYWPDHLWWEERITPSGMNHGMSTASGNVQYEGSIDLDTFPMNRSAGDIIGILVFTYDYGSYQYTGFWPQTADQLKNIAAEHQQTPFSYGDLHLVTVPTSAPLQVAVPQSFELKQNYPNPFNPITSIQFSVPTSCFVTLKIYDLLGKEIETLVNEKRSAGKYTVEWNGKGVPNGIYLYRLQTHSYTETKKLILQK